MGIGDIFNTFFLQPMLNALLWLYSVVGNQFWLAIIIFTVLIRVLMTPLMLPQQRQAKKMQDLQPQLKELQKKYGKDRERMAQEQMKLYREAGASPLGGCLPMLIQFPIWIGLWQSINQALGHQPLQLLGLSQNMYGPLRQMISADVPLNRFFLGMDLSVEPSVLGGLTYLLPVLVAFTMWLQSKMATPAGGDPQMASMNQSMTVMMPVMFGFFSLNFSTGLSLYFVVSNVIGIITQGFISGWKGLLFWKGMRLGGLLGGPRPAQSSEGDSPSRAGRGETSSAGAASDAAEGKVGGTQSGTQRKKKRRRKR
ncbi:MAG: membrane protein insertase YidC [Anaerolineae bacterium]|nr:membrane protein insertase YidC [Anaerolineae bacterium]